MIPQLIIITLGMIGLGANIARHGEKKESEHNWWAFLLVKIIVWTALYYGGFWDVILK